MEVPDPDNDEDFLWDNMYIQEQTLVFDIFFFTFIY